MDIFGALAKLLGGQPQAKQPTPQNNNPLVGGHQPMPGYYKQAVQYERAMRSGDYGNPIVAGPHAVDPRYFGYPADTSGGLRVGPTTNPYQLGSINPIQGYTQNDLSRGIQGGMVNQGYIPLQASRGVGPMQGGTTPSSPLLRLLNTKG